jgi:hypothetical protein
VNRIVLADTFWFVFFMNLGLFMIAILGPEVKYKVFIEIYRLY